MGCTHSIVGPLPLGVGVDTVGGSRGKLGGWNSLLRRLKKLVSRKNRVLPYNDDMDQPSTSYQRDETVNAQDFLFRERFKAAVAATLSDDSEFIDDDFLWQNDMHWYSVKMSMLYARAKNTKGDDTIATGRRNSSAEVVDNNHLEIDT